MLTSAAAAGRRVSLIGGVGVTADHQQNNHDTKDPYEDEQYLVGTSYV